MKIKNIKLLLKKKDLIIFKLFKLEKSNKISSRELDKIYNNLFIPPKGALLKMSQVSRLHKLRHKGKWNKNDYLLVIEPQNYNKVSKLTPKNMMFNKNEIFKQNRKKYIIGSFHSGESGLAHSGDGGDYGDLWWLANDIMERWLIRIIKKGNKILDKLFY